MSDKQWSWKSSQKTYFINIFVLLICNYVPKMFTLNECVRARVPMYTCLYFLFCVDVIRGILLQKELKYHCNYIT